MAEVSFVNVLAKIFLKIEPMSMMLRKNKERL